MTAEEWAVKIAEEVSPVEVDFAPLWAEAFVKGGKHRRELFAQTNARASAFLPGDLIPMMPIILNALAAAAPSLISVLTSEATVKILEVVKNALAIGESIKKVKSQSSADSLAEVPVAGREADYDKLSELMTRLDKETRSLGLSQAKRDRVNLTVLRLLLENPPDAARFIGKLTKNR